MYTSGAWSQHNLILGKGETMEQSRGSNIRAHASRFINNIIPISVNKALPYNVEKKLSKLSPSSMPRLLWARFGLKQPKPDTVSPPPKPQHRWERRWERVRDHAKSLAKEEGSVVYSVVGLITVNKDSSWGRKMPSPRFSWSTPVVKRQGSVRRATVMKTQALLSYDELRDLFVRHYLCTHEPVTIRDDSLDVVPEDFPFFPEQVEMIVPAHSHHDPSGDFYGRYFIAPLRPEWLTNPGSKTEQSLPTQKDLASSLYKAL